MTPSMLTGDTILNLVWDSAGNVSCHISGRTLPEPVLGRTLEESRFLFLAAPGALFLLAQQFGAMQPEVALRTVSTLIESVLRDRRHIIPINGALQHASLRYKYEFDSFAGATFHPVARPLTLFPRGNGMEYGVGQLINNYALTVCAHLDLPMMLMYKKVVAILSNMYMDFLGRLLESGEIGPGRVKWSGYFPYVARECTKAVTEAWVVVDVSDNPYLDELIASLNEVLGAIVPELRANCDRLFKELGIGSTPG